MLKGLNYKEIFALVWLKTVKEKNRPTVYTFTKSLIALF
jgi:hypothetical protein